MTLIADGARGADRDPALLRRARRAARHARAAGLGRVRDRAAAGAVAGLRSLRSICSRSRPSPGTAWAALEFATMLSFFEGIADRDRARVLSAFNLANASAVAIGALVGSQIFSLDGPHARGLRGAVRRSRWRAGSPRSGGCGAVVQLPQTRSSRPAPAPARRARRVRSSSAARLASANARRAPCAVAADLREPAARPDELAGEDREARSGSRPPRAPAARPSRCRA